MSRSKASAVAAGAYAWFRTAVRPHDYWVAHGVQDAIYLPDQHSWIDASFALPTWVDVYASLRTLRLDRSGRRDAHRTR